MKSRCVSTKRQTTNRSITNFFVFSARKKWKRNCATFARIFLGRRNHCRCEGTRKTIPRWHHQWRAQHRSAIAQPWASRAQVIPAHRCPQSKRRSSPNNTGPTRKASVSICVIEIMFIASCIIIIMQKRHPTTPDHAAVHQQTLPMNRLRHKAFWVGQIMPANAFAKRIKMFHLALEFVGSVIKV